MAKASGGSGRLPHSCRRRLIPWPSLCGIAPNGDHGPGTAPGPRAVFQPASRPVHPPDAVVDILHAQAVVGAVRRAFSMDIPVHRLHVAAPAIVGDGDLDLSRARHLGAYLDPAILPDGVEAVDDTVFYQGLDDQLGNQHCL